jgi:hypothetical protein
MKMNSNFSLATANIVVLARSFNPSIISKEWLYNKNIIKDSIKNFVHTPVLSFVETDILSLVVESERAQISLKNTSTENIEALAKITEKLVSILPETPYVSVGFNYDFLLRKEVDNIRRELDEIKKRMPEEKVVVLRDINRNEAKREISSLFASGKTLYYSDIAEELGLDLRIVVELCQELEAEGKVELDDRV